LSFSARFDVQSKVYRYVILNKKDSSVFFKDFSWHIPKPLNVRQMEKASKKLQGKKDFSLFAREATRYKNGVRIVYDISFKKKNSFIYIDIKANGFLRHMARNIVSFLVRIGKGEIKLKEVAPILKKGIPYVNKPAPAQGLYLLKTIYA
jgi:tRNA pseudouridine38-40 synthase